MKRFWKKTLAAAVAALLTLSSPIPAALDFALAAGTEAAAVSDIAAVSDETAAISDSGVIGDLAYSFEDSILTVTGTGEIPDCADGAPWSGYASSIESIVLSDGITAIGVHAFENCAVETVSLPAGLTDVGENAFLGCDELWSVQYGGSAGAWQRVSIGAGNNALLNASVTYAHTLVGAGETSADENSAAAADDADVALLETSGSYDPDETRSFTDLAGVSVSGGNTYYVTFVYNRTSYTTPSAFYRATGLHAATLSIYYEGVDTGLTFDVSVSEKGDVNLDGSINTRDALAVADYLAIISSNIPYTFDDHFGTEGLHAASYYAADVDGDDTLTPDDGAYILYYYSAAGTNQDLTIEDVVEQGLESPAVPDIRIGSVKMTLSELQDNGYQVEIPVTASTVLNRFLLGISLDSDLEYVSSSIYSDSDLVGRVERSGHWLGLSAVSYTDDAGELATITVAVPEDAAAGSVYTLTAETSMRNGMTASVNGAALTSSDFASGNIVIVPDSSSADTPQIDFVSQSVTLEQLQYNDYRVTIEVSSSLALSNYTLAANFDSRLTFIEGGVYDAIGVVTQVQNEITIAGAATTAIQGEIAYITVELPQDTALGDTFTLSGAYTLPSGEVVSCNGLLPAYDDCVISIVDSTSSEQGGESSRQVITFGSVTMSLDELAENNYYVTIPVTANVDVYTASICARLSGGLYYTSGEMDPSLSGRIDSTTSGGRTYVSITGASLSYVDGEIATITVQVTRNATGGSVYTIDGVDTQPDGDDTAINGDAFTYVGGTITITPGASSTDRTILTFGTVNTSLANLRCNNFQIEVPVYADKDVQEFSLFVSVASGLSIVRARLTSGFMGTTYIQGQRMLVAGASPSFVNNRQIATVIVQVPETATVGTRYNIIGVDTFPDGSYPLVDKERVDYVDGSIRVTSGYLLGDTDMDSDVDVADASDTLVYYAEHSIGNDSYVFQFGQIAALAANVNFDGTIDVNDATYILAYYSYQSVMMAKDWEDITGVPIPSSSIFYVRT